jgi:DNA-binding PadR family transcriptional regulator
MKKNNPTPEPMTPIRRALHELVEMGLVEDSGERRNGRIVWRLSPLGMAMSARWQAERCDGERFVAYPARRSENVREPHHAWVRRCV